MIHYIKGQYIMQFDGGVVIEAGGIGYEIYVPQGSAVYQMNEGQTAMLYIHMAVREDDVSLYGFMDKEDLKLFKLLISVSGIGAKGAMAILSVMSAHECRRAIAFEDATMLTRANGIGKKIAQRVVLELKDKVGLPEALGSDEGAKLGIPQAPAEGGARGEAVSALVALGYSRSEAFTALASVQEEGLTSEEYIKKALRNL